MRADAATVDVERLRALLFDRTDALGRAVPGTVYAVLDGAAVDATEHLPTRLWELAPGAHECLYAGTLAPDMAAVAPYLVRLERDAPVSRWLLEQGWGRHWGIFLRAQVPAADLRRHLRRFLIVHDEARRPLHFRYYDPRVLPAYLGSCTTAERRAFVGPVMEFAMQHYPVRNRPGPALLRLAMTMTDELVRVLTPLDAGGVQA